MTREELIAAYRYAGVPDAERLTDAYLASQWPGLAVPSCPSCAAPYAEIRWIGGTPPYGEDHWRCSSCGHDWTTPPARSTP